MCDEADYNYAHVDENHRKARIAHACYACKDVIRPGDVYRVTRCISDYDGHGYEHYKHCLRCATMLDAIRKERPEDAIEWGLNCGESWYDTIGELPDEIAALAFMTPDEQQQTLAVKRD